MPKHISAFEIHLKDALEAFGKAIGKAESSKDFISAYQLLDPAIVDGRSFRKVAFDSLLDAYLDMTVKLPIDQVPLEPYRLMLEMRNEEFFNDEYATAELYEDRADQQENPAPTYTPELVTIFGDHPRIEVIDVMPKWKDAVTCLADVLQSDDSHAIRSRMNRYVGRAIDAFNRNYEPHLDGMLKIKKDARSGKFESDELNRLMMRAEDMDLPPKVLTRFASDLKRMDSMQPTSSDYNSMMHPLLTILDLPWNEKTKSIYTIQETEARMDEKHYGLEKIKQRVAEHVAVQTRTKASNGTILCFDGAPGVGKTSLGETIAYATGRKFGRIALGGTRDVNDIRGHRSTYVNAQAGRIINAIIETGSRNPVILLDEIDKLSGDDVAAAMLEVLDPEQNHRFRDSFIDVDFDLSDVMFIASSNDSSRIMTALKDRMEVIHLPSYTVAAKLQIATRHLLPKQMEKAGLTDNDMMLSQNALRLLIDNYVREPGVRNLNRLIEKLCRKVAYQLETGEAKSILINDKALEDFLGKPRLQKSVLRTDAIGVVNGLAVAGHTGSVLPFEAVRYPSDNGQFTITKTGQMRDVMKESIDVVTAWIKANTDKHGVSLEELHKWHLHIDAPDDCEKDGPSAGTALLSLCLSVLKQTPLRADVAMTGKMSLTGRVLAIGGTIAKLEGAMKDGITTVLIPQENVRDLEEASEDIKAALRLIPVSHANDVLKHVFAPLQLPFKEAGAEANNAPENHSPAPGHRRLPAPVAIPS